MKFNENISAIHGYLCADGYVIKNPETQIHKYYHVGLRNTDKVLLKDFQARFLQVFGIKPIICKDGRCRIGSKRIFQILTKDYSYYSENWSLPKLSKENLRFWLRAFFDCEAWLELDGRKNRRISLDSINYKGLVKIQKVLYSIFNIRAIIKEKKHGSIFRLHIFGKDNIIKFKKEIGFLHPAKKNVLANVIKSYMNYKWEFPKERIKLINFTKKLMKNKVKVKRPYIIRINSIIKPNLKTLSMLLFKLYRIESKIYKRINGYGTIYYELVIQKKASVNTVLKNNLIDKNEKNKIELNKL